MKKLTELLGQPPFIFRGKTLQLTNTGKRLVPLADQLLNEYEKIISLNRTDEIAGDLRISVPESLMLFGLGPIFSNFAREFPQVNLILNNDTCIKNRERLLSNQADIALMFWPPLSKSAQLEVTDFGKQTCSLVTNINGPDSFEELVGQTQKHFVINEKECGYRQDFEKFMSQQNFHNFQTMEVWSIASIKQTIIDGLGFSYLPDFIIQDELNKHLLKRIPAPISSNLHIQLVTRNTWQSPATIEMSTLIKKRLNQEIMANF